MRVCPSCGAENDDRAKFCSQCATSLEAGAVPGLEERKVVSVLFVDLVDSTARASQADPEDVRATLRVYHERLKSEIESFGGVVEKFIGDAVMAVFGAPVAHEDDAERAVRAALRTVEAIDDLNSERGFDLAVRAAVNTGEAVVALGARPEQGESFVAGDVVNVAARLQSEAPVGGVVVGELTYRATTYPIEYEPMEPVAVKGKEDALPLWRALGARSRFGVDIEPGTATPLIGRDHELSLIRDLYRRAVREQRPQLITLSGEPGVGKSRLVREFRSFIDELPELVYWRQGRCLPYGEGIAFWALGEVVKSHAGILENDGPDEAAAKLAEAVASVIEVGSERDWIRGRLAPLVGVGDAEGSAQREESFAAWRAFLEAIAASRPFVLVLEDLHWADPAMLAFVEHLADWAASVPLLVLCTARPELYERQPGWGGGTRNHTSISLSPLTTEETARLIAALLDQAVLPAETQEALLARAGGNPLYAEEFIRMLVDRGLLEHRGAAWTLATGAEIPVPESLHALIAARLDTLSPERKALLQDAAVIGKVFWAGAVAEMGGVDAAAVRDGLHELARKELVRPARRPSIEGESEYAFWHLLIRDVAYGQIPRATRAAKHRAAAGWIERISGERIADSAELLAYHSERALELARAAGEDVTELEATTVRFLTLASEQAMRLDGRKARSYLERALELAPPGAPARIQVLVLGVRLFVSGWGGPDSDERFDALAADALQEARAQHDRLAEGEIHTLMSQTAWRRGETTRQHELVDAALRILRELPPGKELAGALVRSAAAYGLAGRSDESLPRIEAALPIVSEHGTPHILAILLQFRGQARLDLGQLEEGMADLREGLRIAMEAASAGMAASAHVNLGDAVWFQEGPAQGQELYERAVEIAERRGSPGAEWWARMQSMWTRFDLGRWDEVLEIGGGVMDFEPDRATPLSVLAESFRQAVLIHRGRLDGEVVLEGTVLPRAREIGDDQVVIPAFRAAALLRLARGDAPAALSLVRELGELMSDRRTGRAWALEALSPVSLATGDTNLLRDKVAGMTPYLTRDRLLVASAEAVIAEVAGDLEDAIRLYDAAAEGWETFPHVLEHGRSLLGSGRCLLQLGRTDEASERLRRARGVLAGLRAAPLVGEADDLLGQATALSS